MWKTSLRKDAEVGIYLRDFQDLLKAGMSLSEGLKTRLFESSEFRQVQSDLEEIIQAVDSMSDDKLANRTLHGEDELTQAKDLMETLVLNITTNEDLEELSSEIHSLKKVFDAFYQNEISRSDRKITQGKDTLYEPYIDPQTFQEKKRKIEVTHLGKASALLETLELLKRVFENPLQNSDDELEYDTKVYTIVDKWGKGELFNKVVKPIYESKPRTGPLYTNFVSLYRQAAGGRAGLDENSTESSKAFVDYGEKLILREQNIQNLLNNNVKGTKENLYERMVSMVKRRDVSEAFKVKTQEIFDRIFSGDSKEEMERVAETDDMVSRLMESANAANDGKSVTINLGDI